MAMNSFRIVESFQILKNQLVCLLIVANFKAIEPFTFDNRMKGFNACIIPRKSLKESKEQALRDKKAAEKRAETAEKQLKSLEERRE